MKIIVAIDPGVSGGFAISWGGKIECHRMARSEGDRVELLRGIQRAAVIEGWELVCVVEFVTGFAGEDRPGARGFVLGENYGFLKGVIQALGIRQVLVCPHDWQKVLGVGKRSDYAGRSEWKNRLKAEAQRRFPQVKVRLWNADALLLLDYAATPDV